jgi:cobalt-zinc-cadmium efflux system protein
MAEHIPMRSPAPGAGRDRRLLAVLGLNAVVVAGSVVFGLAAGSLGLLADAGHNLADVAAVVASLAAVRISRRAPNERRSFGYHRGTVLAAQANAAGLLAVTALIIYEGGRRLIDPQPVEGGVVLAVATAAFVANAASVLLLRGDRADLNMRSALLHMAGDAAASLGVAVAGAVILVTGRFWRLDPAVSIGIALLVAWQAWRLFRATGDVLLESTPAGVDTEQLASTMRGVAGVEDVHDLHVWSLSSDVHALSAHVVLLGHPSLEAAQAVGSQVKAAVSRAFGVAHATLELECEGCVDDGSWCAMDALCPGTTARAATLRRGES